MTFERLGRLEKVDLRDFWQSEADDWQPDDGEITA
jgi:hypothetical protein